MLLRHVFRLSTKTKCPLVPANKASRKRQRTEDFSINTKAYFITSGDNGSSLSWFKAMEAEFCRFLYALN